MREHGERPRGAGYETRRQSRIGSFQRFRLWCAEHDLPSLPTRKDVIAQFVRELSTHMEPEDLNACVLAIRRTHLIVNAAYPGDAPSGAIQVGKRRLTLPRSVPLSSGHDVDGQHGQPSDRAARSEG